MRSDSIENTLKNLICEYINDGLTEKFAKTKALSDIDYIIQMERNSDGSLKLATIVELTPAKTMPLSVKKIMTDN